MDRQKFAEYRLLDCGNFEKVEDIAGVRLVRPAASAIWRKSNPAAWEPVDWKFIRNNSGGGKWQKISGNVFESTPMQCGPIKMHLRPTPFGHLGLFAEQMEFWQRIIDTCEVNKAQPIKVLNLFAYTGGASIASALGGAEVVHVDASKTSVEWARENAQLNGLSESPVRWIVDDVSVFVKREVRRNNKYQGVILDPPSYGRGPKNQLWKIEEHLPQLIADLKQILADDFLFFHLSAHTPGISAMSLENLLHSIFGSHFNFCTEEMKIKAESGLALPSGTSCWMTPEI